MKQNMVKKKFKTKKNMPLHLDESFKIMYGKKY